jgi:hypothetical protein
MSFRNRLVLPIILSSLAVLAGCGSSTKSPTAPPAGAFSNTNLNGTYTFSVLGFDANSSEFAMAGSFTACGCSAGTISAGTVDLVDNTGTDPATPLGSNSTYSITSDGRGFAKLFITPTGIPSFEIDLDFVLTSSSHGLITRYDGTGTGSGTIDLQTAVAQSGVAGVPFAFSVSGTDLAGDPLAQAGAFTLDSSGNISASGANAGVADTTLYNFNTFIATPYADSALTGVLQVGSGTTPGPATLATSFGTLTFDVYAIDSTHLKLIENDGLEILVGDVFTQPSATIPSGNMVFTMAGPDPGGNPFAAAGLMASDGISQISSGSEDLNDAGVVDFGSNPVAAQSFTGTFAATGGGRFLVTLSTFAGGTTFAAYPSNGGLLMQEIDAGAGSGVTTGVALAQTSGASVAASQGYGLDLTGVDLANLVEFDEIAEFQTTSTGLSGLLDANDGGLGTSNLSGTYAVGTDGVGSATLTNGFQGMFFYSADNSTALLLSTDPLVVGTGIFEAQTTPSQAAAMARPRALATFRPVPHPRAASRANKAAFVRR